MVFEFVDLKDPGLAFSGEELRPIRDMGIAVGAVRRLRRIGVGVDGCSSTTVVFTAADTSEENPAGIGGMGGTASSSGTLIPMNSEALRLSS
ncbi:hypothetical protein E6O75_ATG01010 [Venturia nashicola]|uniref:Uncharacterized protein n=1 Tax=Venturia nashicola TaxID=86259 RepID=A0A4Z1PTB2_9PEZI|nr:hypothetical protein E6O75_ATG01010 [Venturia nashicola]